MLYKLIVLFKLILIINLKIKLSVAANIKQNVSSVLQRKEPNFKWNSLTTADEDTWQPIIQNQKWMSASTNLTSKNSVSITPSMSLVTSLFRNENFKNNSISNVVKEKYKPELYYNYPYNHQLYDSGNYSKRHIKPSSANSKSSLASESLAANTPSQSIKNAKLKSSSSYVLPTNHKNNNNYARGRGKIQINSHQQHNHQQKLFYPLNNAETLYPHIQIPKDIISQIQEQQQHQQQPLLSLTHQENYEKNSISSQHNLQQHLTTDTATKYQQHTIPSSFSSTTSSNWYYLQRPSQLEAKNIISLIPKIDTSNMTNTNTYTELNVKTNTHVKREENQPGMSSENIKNINGSILRKTLNSFPVNENLINNEITNNNSSSNNNNKRYHHQPYSHHHEYYKNLQNTSNGVKNVMVTTNSIQENSPKTTKSVSDITPTPKDTSTNNVENLNIEFMLLKQTLNNAQIFYDNIKDIILNDKDNNSANSSSVEDVDDDDEDDDDTYSNEDKTNDDNDLQIQNFSPLQAFKDTSTTVAAISAAAAIEAAAMEKIDSLNMKNMLLSPSTTSSIDEVQGRKIQNDKGTIKYSLISSQSPSPPQTSAASSSSSYPADISKTQYVTINNNYNDTHQPRGRVWNLPTNSYATKHSSLMSSKSKRLITINSGRKVKKVKKKLKKLLLPLLLAYKLKFMALIPLLIGGLTLLVGSTGLAGFFFALFTAVMSLKSGRSVVVKKYVH